MSGYIGLLQQGKSTLAYKAMDGRGLFLTFKGVPPHLPQPPLIPNDSKAYSTPQALAWMLSRHNLLQWRIGSNFLDVLETLRHFDDLTVCFDDLFVLMKGDKCHRLALARDAFDAYVKEVGQKRHRVIITTHRFTRELSTFVQENIQLYYVGPCLREGTLRDLVDVSNLNAPEADIERALRSNPSRTAFLIKS